MTVRTPYKGAPGDDARPAATDEGAWMDAVPDAAPAPAMPYDEDVTAEPGDFPAALDTDELILGGEAAVPPGDYGPPIASILPDRSSLSSEFRELQRRVKAQLSPAFPIEEQRRLPLAFVWKRYRKLAMRDRSDVVDEFGRDPVFLSRFEPVLDFLHDRYFRVETSGLEHIPDTGRALLVANHSGTVPYDGAILMHAVRRGHPAHRDVRPLVEDFVFHMPYLGTFINRIGGVRACQENAERLLRAGRVVAVFPEGVKGIGKLYRDRYKLQRFGRGGFVKLALRTRAPIIPVAIVGAEEIHPMVSRVTWFSKLLGVPYVPITPTFPWLGPAGLLPLPSKWILRFGPPIDVAAEVAARAPGDGQGGEPEARHGEPDDSADRIVIGQIADRVRATIQRMIDEALAARRSVIFG